MGPRWDGTRPTLAERSGDPATGSPRPSGIDPAPGPPRPGAVEPARPRPVAVRHCWIADLPDLPGRHAGLLVEWRRDDAEWLARVVYAFEDAGSPVLVEAWVAARHLSPAR